MSAAKLNSILANPTLRANLEKRFWRKVDRRGPDDCWTWTAKAVISTLKYGAIQLGDNIVTGSHRVAYALSNGQIGEEDVIRHECDNPSCCNPKHLLAGTQADNHRDMMERGRHKPVIYTPEVRQKIREGRARNPPKVTPAGAAARVAALKKRWSDPEFRRTWSEKMGGDNSPFRGRTFKHTPEAREKIRQAGLGRKHSEETKAKQSAAAMGRKMPPRVPISEETRERMRAASRVREAKKRNGI